MLNLRQLEYFYYVAKYSGFTRAARRVDFPIQQPALSLQVKALEENLHVKLYRMAGKRFRLTSSGEYLFRAVTPFFESLENIERELRGETHGRLVVAEAAPMLILREHPHVLARFHERFPGVQVSVLERPWTALLESVAGGEVDLAFGSAPELTGGIAFEEWAETDYLALLPPGHPLTQAETITLTTLADQPLILLERGTADRQHIEDTFARANLLPHITLETSSYGLINESVVRGLGVAVVNALWPHPADPEWLFPRPVTHLFGKKRIGLFRRTDAYLPPYALEYLRLLREGRNMPSN